MVEIVGDADAAGFTVSTAVRVAPPALPEMLTNVDVETETVVIANVVLVAPPATVTLAGTVAAAVLLLDKLTVAPPEGAALVRVTVP